MSAEACGGKERIVGFVMLSQPGRTGAQTTLGSPHAPGDTEAHGVRSAELGRNSNGGEVLRRGASSAGSLREDAGVHAAAQRGAKQSPPKCSTQAAARPFAADTGLQLHAFCRTHQRAACSREPIVMVRISVQVRKPSRPGGPAPAGVGVWALWPG